MKKTKKPKRLYTPLLFDDLEETPPPPKNEKPRKPTIRERFLAFHAANPQVLAALLRFAYEAKRAGRTRLGMQMLFERVRWYTSVETKGDEFKLNNDFAAHYARFIADGNPDFEGFFETRKLRAK